MGYRFEQPDFRVSVEGAFVAPRFWLIHAAICYRRGLGIDARHRLGPEADLAMMRGVGREAGLAWSLGAERVRVVVDGDGDLDRFFEVLKADPAELLTA